MSLSSRPAEPAGPSPADGPRLTYAVRPAEAGVSVVTVAGELDHGTHQVLLDGVGELMEQLRPRLELDLSAVAFCDSTGLGALVRLHRQAEDRGGWLRVVRPADDLRRMLRVTNLDRLLGGADPDSPAVDGAGHPPAG